MDSLWSLSFLLTLLTILPVYAAPTVNPTDFPPPALTKQGNITFKINSNKIKYENGYVYINLHEELSITAISYHILNDEEDNTLKNISDIWESITWTCNDCPTQYKDLTNLN